jgi:hypothetical protein
VLTVVVQSHQPGAQATQAERRHGSVELVQRDSLTV